MQGRSSRVVFATCVGALATLALAWAGASPLTSSVSAPGVSPTTPTWLPASAAESNEGDPVGNLPPLSQWLLDRFLASGGNFAAGDCIRTEDTISDAEVAVRPLTASLETLIDSASAIFSGSVRSIVPGFWEGLPAALAEIQVETWLRRDKVLGPTEGAVVYLVLPNADFHVGRYHFCTSDSRWSAFPANGDRILAAMLSEPVIARPFVYHPVSPPVEIFLSGHSGLTVAPAGLVASGAVSGGMDFDSLLNLVTKIANEKSGDEKDGSR